MSDGNIQYLGRLDYQVKIRGHRIELGEIETVLCQHPAVREAVVTAREDQPGAIRLVAYLVGGNNEVPSTFEMRRFLKKQLPVSMLPDRFVSLASLPRTPNAKLDRRALPLPDKVQSNGEVRGAAPQTPMEISLAKIWQEVLQVERAGVHDNFLDLGGHSLLAMQVIDRIEKQHRLRVDPTELMMSTLGQLACACEHQLSHI